jgi:hypothetical protein
MRSLAEEFPPSIIIDDGSHVSEHIVKSFEMLFSYLLPGGYYVIEDVAFHFNGEPAAYSRNVGEAGHPEGTLQNLLNKLIFAKLSYCNEGTPYSEIDELRLINGAVFIKKRRPRDHQQTRRELERELDYHAASGPSYAFVCFRMAEYLLAYHHDPEQALKYIERGAFSQPDLVYGLQLRHLALARLGREDEAAAIARRLDQMGQPIKWEPVFTKHHMTYPHP